MLSGLSLVRERKQRPVIGYPLQGVLTAVVEAISRPHGEILYSARYENLVRRSQRLQASSNVNRQPYQSLLV